MSICDQYYRNGRGGVIFFFTFLHFLHHTINHIYGVGEGGRSKRCLFSDCLWGIIYCQYHCFQRPIAPLQALTSAHSRPPPLTVLPVWGNRQCLHYHILYVPCVFMFPTIYMHFTTVLYSKHCFLCADIERRRQISIVFLFFQSPAAGN